MRVLHGFFFRENATRSFRAVRFAARLDFAIADETEQLLRVARREEAFSALSPTRLGREVERLLGERRLSRAVRMLARLRLLEVLHPRLLLSARGKARLERTEEVLAWARLTPGAPEVRAWLLPMGVLLGPGRPGCRAGARGGARGGPRLPPGRAGEGVPAAGAPAAPRGGGRGVACRLLRGGAGGAAPGDDPRSPGGSAGAAGPLPDGAAEH